MPPYQRFNGIFGFAIWVTSSILVSKTSSIYGLPWIPIFFCHEWGDSTMVFTSDVTRENHCRIVSWMTTSVFTVTHTLFYFLHAIICPDREQKPAKQSSMAPFAIFSIDGIFWLGIATSPQFNLWRQAKARYWHCDVIFVDCSCTRKLAQLRSSLMNNNHE